MKNNLNDRLKTYQYFQECVIKDIQFKRFGSDITILINNIWDITEENTIRKDLDKEDIISIRFKNVFRFKFENRWIDAYSQMNWSYYEFSRLEQRMEKIEVKGQQQLFYKVIFLWEDKERKMEVLAKDIEILMR